jgi:hypothetical protein
MLASVVKYLRCRNVNGIVVVAMCRTLLGEGLVGTAVQIAVVVVMAAEQFAQMEMRGGIVSDRSVRARPFMGKGGTCPLQEKRRQQNERYYPLNHGILGFGTAPILSLTEIAIWSI